jgi:diguanylate cyclase (GGDEF)-like protein
MVAPGALSQALSEKRFAVYCKAVEMTFRGRLRVFFTIIVIVPMVAVAAVLFRLTADSETGKADAGLAAGLRTAFAVYSESSARAEPRLRSLARNAELVDGLAAGGARARAAVRRAASAPGIVSARFRPAGASRAITAGSDAGIASAGAPLVDGRGRRLGTLAVSVTRARPYARRVRRLTGLQVGVFQGEVRVDTGRGARRVPRQGGDFELGGREYRGRIDRFRDVAGPAVSIAVYDRRSDLGGSAGRSRLLIGGILLGFLLLALSSSVFVVRALHDQIDAFLNAARRLAKGDFKTSVPTEGRDEFAQLGREFNSMSQQLEAKIEEVERQRRELEETIRRVGVAFASGLDPQGVIELTVDTALDACGAEYGRALPLVDGRIVALQRGVESPQMTAAVAAAERSALHGENGRSDADRHAAENASEGVSALAMPIRAPHHKPEKQVGVVSIARRGEFSRADRDLFEYLAGQAAISIENADLHETVQRQAITDELTGLSNVRELHTMLDREVERSRRFKTSLSLVMLDLDDFKQVNDVHGHQQGDRVLKQVGRVLRELSRDIDEPARYGGEELAVVALQTDSYGSAQLAERMREAIEGLRIPRLDGQGDLAVTASFGVASFPDDAADKGSLIAAADAALYRAKRAGKNRVERAGALAAPR